DDMPDDGMLDALVAAQAASGADAVTAAVRPADDPEAVQLFLGDAGPLGLVENHYGVLGMLRRSLAARHTSSDGAADLDWPLFARLALAGAQVVSIPESLAMHTRRPGTVGEVPGEGLAVLEAFEQDATPHDLPQLAATLAAASARVRTVPSAPRVMSRGAALARRLLLRRGRG